MNYKWLFVKIQLRSLVLSAVGIPLCAYLAWFGMWTYVAGKFHWANPRFNLWDNKEDGICASWYRAEHLDWSLERCAFYWSALRNPCNNLRFEPGVSEVGRPLWKRFFNLPHVARNGWRLTFSWRPSYAQAGWNESGYPVLSAGYLS
jgi:hypothetical protein